MSQTFGAVTQLAEQLLSMPEDTGLNPAIAMFIEHLFAVTV